MRALENVKQKSDWKQPKGPAGQKWKSKVQMGLYDRIEWDAVEGSSTRYAPPEPEMRDDMQSDALFAKYQSTVGEVEDPNGDGY